MSASSPFPWTLEHLKTGLNQEKRILHWILSVEHIHRLEQYFIEKGAIDQDREVNAHHIFARFSVKLSESGRVGEMTKKFFPSRPLQPQIEAGVRAALQTSSEAWRFPQPEEPSSGWPLVQTADPRIEEDLMGSMSALCREVKMCASRSRKSTFNSAELFLSVHNRELHFSSGAVYRSAQSRAYAEAAFSSSTDEYVNRRWSVNLDHLAIQSLFNEADERALSTEKVEKLEPGHYSVLVDSEALGLLFHDFLPHLSGSSAYLKLPFKKPGDDLIPGARGDLISLTLDPLRSFGADSAPVSDLGSSQNSLILVTDNRVVATSADQQYSNYLGIAPTSVRGDLVVAAGTRSYAELTHFAPQVLEILQFSALFTHAASGTFSSEIRLAKLHDRQSGQVRWIKGGSVSGSLFENFLDLKLSSERISQYEFHNTPVFGLSSGRGYFGPKFALLNDVSVAG